MATPLIEFKDVTKRFGEKAVLNRVNLQVYEGEITTVVGLSGGGKPSSSNTSSVCLSQMRAPFYFGANLWKTGVR